MLTFNPDLHFIYCVASHQLISYLYLWNHCLPSQWRRWAFVCNQWVCTCDLWGSGLRSIYPIWTSLSFFSVCLWVVWFLFCVLHNNVRGVSACKTKLSKVVQLQVGSHQLCLHKLVSEWHLQPLPSCNPIPPGSSISTSFPSFIWLHSLSFSYILGSKFTRISHTIRTWE